MKIPMVYIEFYDHQSQSKWLDKQELDKFSATTVHQIGWLVGQDKKVYKVSGQIDSENGDVGDTIAILKSTVTKFRRIRIKL